MANTARHVALLAPVPLEHLLDGQIVAVKQGKVAFGSRVWELFQELDQLRKGQAVDLYIYASHTVGPQILEATWHAEYIGHVHSVEGAHPEGMLYRPPSTAKYRSDNEGHWAVFWEVQHLRPLPEGHRVRLVDLEGFGKEKRYRRGFIPERPFLIEHP